MNVLSLFDGMSCGQIALQRVGISVDNYFASEIDPYAKKIAKKNYPNTTHIGDVRCVTAANLPKIDLVIGGSPCQGFSFLGKRLNFDDPRSSLFFEYVRILKEVTAINPDAKFLLENVRMNKQSRDAISDILGVQPIQINSALVSAQQRNRLYWTNIAQIEQPQDKCLKLVDILDSSYDNKHILSEKTYNKCKRKGNKLFNSIGIQDKANCLIAGYYKLGGRDCTYVKIGDINGDFKLRKFTPNEAEKLQTVPIDYTQGVSDTQRYKMLGNGWTVDVIAHIFSYLNK